MVILKRSTEQITARHNRIKPYSRQQSHIRRLQPTIHLNNRKGLTALSKTNQPESFEIVTNRGLLTTSQSACRQKPMLPTCGRTTDPNDNPAVRNDFVCWAATSLHNS
ncbi:hypothetical protein AVEN_200253-1 [Araneus ventricosus]|uniref:Uncharacterized protein n=1 Tax=Araneus ventricosus TaxID=182803 RepID=A0A4Y2DSR4_ARAVE|nr:hypothetical protein AVEN_200253-1 [Araneus ventricosus]